MTRKVIILTDPGIDGAYATALAMLDPQLDVLAVAATAGNIGPDQATKNVHVLVEHLDPPKWPRIGAALPIEYEIDGTELHGPNGLGGVDYPVARLHQPLNSDKQIVDTVRQFPGEVTIIVLGPCTALAAALKREADLVDMVEQFIILGGAYHEPGNSGPVVEFHFACDPLAARSVMLSGGKILLIPLDVSRQALLSPTEIQGLYDGGGKVNQFLKRITPFALGATQRLYGIEGFHVKDALGVFAAAHPSRFQTQPMTVDVETQGELTSGMSIFDTRQNRKPANVEMATEVEMPGLRGYMLRLFH